MNCKYMAVALQRGPRLKDDAIGVLKPVLADGMYASRQDAWGVAEFMKWKHPEYRCLVVEVLEDVDVDPSRDADTTPIIDGDDVLDEGDEF